MREDNKHPATLAAYLREAREQAGYSIRELAKRVGVHHSYLARLETGETANPAPDLLERLARELDVDSTELLAYVNISLPEPRAYFRRKLGVDAEEADVLAQLIEDYQAKKRREDRRNEDTN